MLRTCWKLFRLPARDPFSVLELPVMSIGKHHVHEDVVMALWVKVRQTVLERRKHSSAITQSMIHDTCKNWKVKEYCYHGSHGFESFWASSFILRCSISLCCGNEYLAIDSGWLCVCKSSRNNCTVVYQVEISPGCRNGVPLHMSA